ncbi:MAG: SDR family NAD(P)-dependent oxidoreductase [Planctomycetaceae bacterium]|jgi:NAD(P)-dependent dehydrogenase (short-subunit alcohol dehydrogenase family)|nr:SDR family NAD(P)-dependent oxidoreductase [Planctomycetaceae bacterium]
MSYWQNKIVLVTGGSSGLGRIIAEEFFRAGAKLAIVALEKSDVEKAALEIGSEVLPVHADITKQDDVNRIFETVRQHWGRLDVLVNNAGRSMRGKVLDTTPEQFQSLFDLNVLGTIRCTRAAAAMLLEHHGHIVNIGSLAAKSAARYVGAYPVSKFAVAAYSQQLRLELEPEGLHVLLVCPGPIRREQERLYPLEGLEDIPDSARAPGAGVKVGRIDPQWLARKILYCCEHRKPELVVPAKAKILFAIAQLFPTLGDWLVKKNS